MGYRSEIRENNDLYPAMFLLNNMLGGYFHSTLFQEIREKHSSLSCSSSNHTFKKLLTLAIDFFERKKLP